MKNRVHRKICTLYMLYNKYVITNVSHVSHTKCYICVDITGFSTSPVSKDRQSSLFGQSMKPIYSDQSEAVFENDHLEATLAAILS